MTGQRVLFISYHFYPSVEIGAKRPSETVKYLSATGLDVSIIRGCRPSDLRVDSIGANVGIADYAVVIPRKRVTEIWSQTKAGWRKIFRGTAERSNSGIPYQNSEGQRVEKRISWMRRQYRILDTLFLSDKLWLFRCFVRIVLLKRRQFDVIIASGPPMGGYIAGAFASKVFQAPLILDFRDPWILHSDTERYSQYTDHPLARFEDYIGQFCVSRSSRIVVTSPGIERHLKESFKLDQQQIDLVRNGYDEDAIITVGPPQNRLELLYAGTLYINRNPFPFLEALDAFVHDSQVDREKVRFRLVGKCSSWRGVSLRSWLAHKQLDDVVKISAPVVRAELTKYVMDSNVLINFAQGQPRQIPAKSYEYLAAGRDVITFAEPESDVADLFRQAKIGYIVEPGNESSSITIMHELYQRYVVQGRKRDLSRVDTYRFSRAPQLEKFLSIVKATLSADA